MGWGRVETERSGHGYGGICGHGLTVERKRQRIGLLGRIVGSCRRKEEAEDRSVGSGLAVEKKWHGSDRWVCIRERERYS